MEEIKVKNEEENNCLESVIKVEEEECLIDDSLWYEEKHNPTEVKTENAVNEDPELTYFEVTEIEEPVEASIPEPTSSGRPRRSVKKSDLNCSCCDTTCSSKHNVSRHSRKNHPRSRQSKVHSVRCKICRKVCKGSEERLEHMREKHPDKYEDPRIYECFHCGVKKTTIAALKRHISIHTTERNFSCEICEKAFKTKSCVKAHIRRVHVRKNKVKCPQCSKIVWESYLAQHRATQHSEKTIPCPMCSKKFKYDNMLRRHMIVHQKAKNGPNCQICQAKLINEEDLKIHMKTHEFFSSLQKEETKEEVEKPKKQKEKLYECRICKKTTSAKYVLEQHSLIHTSTEAIFKCGNCPKAFTREVLLNQHIAYRHSGGGSCPICEKVFPGERSLKQHMKTHENTIFTELKCEICKKGYRGRVHLYRHLLNVHKLSKEIARHVSKSAEQKRGQITRKKPIPKNVKPKEFMICPICGQSYKNNSQLRHHMVVHDRFKCHMCPAKFPELGPLQIHLNIHFEKMDAEKAAKAKLSASQKTGKMSKIINHMQIPKQDPKPQIANENHLTFDLSEVID